MNVGTILTAVMGISPYRVRHRLLTADERLTERERRRLIVLFEREPLIAEAWALEEAFRAIYRAHDRREAEHRVNHSWPRSSAPSCPLSPLFAEGVRLWRALLLAYFDEPTTNGYAEGVINKIEAVLGAQGRVHPARPSLGAGAGLVDADDRLVVEPGADELADLVGARAGARDERMQRSSR